ncbi:MAG: hypothetical protein ACUBOA_13120 [Candidatus Loosdrechtia sp.]|uniref:hypothetical protein n=1 Tax=Candidatus Loosdrechtia sp. TaxID=3101272 RepID=UPI003A7A56BC|nr:MAG: hypothetical protein QY305_11280 [Candidatus Jettenia sp. AMX2]
MIEAGVNFYSLYGLTIEVRWEGKGIKDEIDLLFSPFPFTMLSCLNNTSDITLHFAATDIPPNIPYPKSEPISFYGLSIYEMGDAFYITDGLSTFQARPQAGIGSITLYCSFKKNHPVSKYNLFLVGIFHLFPYQYFYHLHAAGLMKDGAGYLFIGESGSGKSSVSLGLVRQGWHYLSDDVLLLRLSVDGVEALSFRKRFYVDPALINHYPKITPYLKKTYDGEDTKQLLDLEPLYPDRFCPNCLPRVLIFTRIVSQSESKLIPIDQTSALIKLMKQSATLFFNRKIIKEHAEVLKRLLYQTQSYQLFLGTDVWEKPEKISEVLGQHEECTHSF